MQLNLQYEHIKTDLIFNAPSYRWKDDPPYHFNVRYPQEYVGRNVTIPEGATYFRIWNANKFNGNVKFTTRINNLYAAFYNCYNFNQPISFDKKIEMSPVSLQDKDANYIISDAAWMFANCFNFDSVVRFPTYNVLEIADVRNNIPLFNGYAMFANCFNMHGQIYNFPSYGGDYAYCFFNCQNLDQEIYFGIWRYENTLNAGSHMYQQGADFNINMFAMFANCFKLKSVNIDLPLTSRASNGTLSASAQMPLHHYYGNCIFINRQYMFANCYSLKQPPFPIADIRRINIKEMTSHIPPYTLYYGFDFNFACDAIPMPYLDEDNHFSPLKGLFFNCQNLKVSSAYLLTSVNLNVYPYRTFEDLTVNLNADNRYSGIKMPCFSFLTSGLTGIFDLSEMFYNIDSYYSHRELLWFSVFSGGTGLSMNGTFAGINNFYMCREEYVGTSELPTKKYKGERFQRKSYIDSSVTVENTCYFVGCFYKTNFFTKPSELSAYTFKPCSESSETAPSIFGGFPSLCLNVSVRNQSPEGSCLNMQSMFDNATFKNVEPTVQQEATNPQTFINSYVFDPGIRVDLRLKDSWESEAYYYKDAYYNIDLSSMFENFTIDVSKNFRSKPRFVITPMTGGKMAMYRAYYTVTANGTFRQAPFNGNTYRINAANFARNFKFNINKLLNYSTRSQENATIRPELFFEVPYFYDDSDRPISSDYNNMLDPYTWESLSSISESLNAHVTLTINVKMKAGYSYTTFTNAIDHFKSTWSPIISMPLSSFIPLDETTDTYYRRSYRQLRYTPYVLVNFDFYF